MKRREFLGCALLPLAASPAEAGARKIWIDPKLADLPSRPWRKVHLDFHNSQHVPKIGEKFNADEFGDRLLEGNVNSIVVFAKDMHGYFYYPSKYGPVHPGLSFDLLGAQVEACRKRKIQVSAYYCTTWDNYLAEKHPEWLVQKRDRTTYLPKFNETPRWTALCIAYEDFVQLMVDHTREFVSKYQLDGAWFDMPVPVAGECFCRECLRLLHEKELDPFDPKVQRLHKQQLELSFLKRLTDTVRNVRPGCQVDYNCQAVLGLGQRAAFMDNIDIEALPTVGQWGYYYFPTVTRYTRTFGLTTYGMTGRFKASWADFGGLKLPAQLDTEVAAILANAARCDIGDQMPPNGRLDPAVYHVIGKVYGKIRKLEPYLDQAAPVSEAAILVDGLPLERPGGDETYGLLKLLVESRVQFDVVETAAEWERYQLVVLREDLPVAPRVAERLHAFVEQGGAVIAIHQGGLIEGGQRTWLERYGLAYAGISKFKPAYLVPKQDFTGGLPAYEYALYEGASQWRAQPPAQVVAQLGEPLFQRAPEHYTSHAQTPFDHETDYAAVAVSGRVALVGFPLGTSYFTQGYWVYRKAFQHVLKAVLPVQVAESNAPLSAEVQVTHQAARPESGRKERYLVHVVNWSANRGTPRHPVFYEEEVPLTDITVRLNVPGRIVSARAVVSGTALSLRRIGAAVEVTVPRIPVNEIICLEVG
jgi:hypothetical protein